MYGGAWASTNRAESLPCSSATRSVGLFSESPRVSIIVSLIYIGKKEGEIEKGKTWRRRNVESCDEASVSPAKLSYFVEREFVDYSNGYFEVGTASPSGPL